MGRLLEVRYQWNIDDLIDAHDLLDMKSEQEQAILDRGRT